MKPGEKSAAAVVADANVLLAAMTGRAAQKAFFSGVPLKVYTSVFAVAEAMEYLHIFCERYKVSQDFARKQLADLPIEVKERDFYMSFWDEAFAVIGKRDPDDVDVAALALKLGIPVWSNDEDFQGFPLGRFTTAELLKYLGC